MGLFGCLCGASEHSSPERAYLPTSLQLHVSTAQDKNEWIREEKEQRARAADVERDGRSDSDGERFVDRHASGVDENSLRRREAAEDPSARTLPGEDYRRWDDHPVRNDYVILSSLGRGAFAEVALGMHKVTGKKAALKVVFLNKPGLKEKHLAILQREGNYLMKMQHRNIVKCTKIYRAPTQWVFVMEHLKGGMLLNDLAKLKRYSEKIAAVVFKQLLRATEYLHDNKIVHRDIKPENVVFKHSLSGSHNLHSSKSNVVKLVDFGMVLDLRKEPTARGMMGSPGFVAPEVILGGYHTTQMDMYSLGVLLFVMLVGAKPMTQEQAKSMQYAVMPLESLRGVHDPRWRVLSDAAKDMVMNLLALDPKARYTAKMALNHPWLRVAREESVIDGSVMEGWADTQHMHAAAFMGNPLGAHMARSPMAGALTNMMSPHGGHTPVGAMALTPRGNSSHTPHAGGGRSGPFSNIHLLSPMSNTGQHQSPFDPHSTVPISPAHYSMHSLPGQPMQSSHHRTVGTYDPMTTQLWTGTLSESGYTAGPHTINSVPLQSQPSGGLSGAPVSGHEQRASSLQLHSYGSTLNRAAVQAAHDQAIKKAQEAHAQVQRYLMTAQAIASHPSAFASPNHHRTAPAQVTYEKHESPRSQIAAAAALGVQDASGMPSALAHVTSGHSGHTSTHFTHRDESCSLSDNTQQTVASAPGAPPKGASGTGEMVMSTAKIMDEAHNLMEELRQAPSLSANGELAKIMDEAQLRLATQRLAAMQLAQQQQQQQQGQRPLDGLRGGAQFGQQGLPHVRSGTLSYTGPYTNPPDNPLFTHSTVDDGAPPYGAYERDGARAQPSPHVRSAPGSDLGNGDFARGDNGQSAMTMSAAARNRTTWRKSKSQAMPSAGQVSILTKEIPDLARDAYYASGASGAPADAAKRGLPRPPPTDRQAKEMSRHNSSRSGRRTTTSRPADEPDAAP